MIYLKRILLLFLLLVFTQSVITAQKSPVRIKEGDLLLLTKVGTPDHKVKIDGVWRTKGYRFTPEKKIELSKGQYIIVTNLTTGFPNIAISGNDLINTHTSSISSFVQERIAAGKGNFKEDEEKGFGRFLKKYPWYMIEDSLYIPTNYLLDNNHGFLLKTIPGNKYMRPSVPYDKRTNELVLTKDYFNNNGLPLESGGIFQFRVEYWEGNTKSTFITDNLFIEFIQNK